MSEHSGKFLKVTTPSDGVALIQITRPPVNAFHKAMWTEIPAVFNRLSQDNSVRVVVLASSQRIFTAGLDLGETEGFAQKDSDPSRNALAFRPLIDEFQVAINAIENCRVPVIAAVHGIAYGLALDILSACDIRYATENALFSIKEVDIGMASDVGTLARFPFSIGNSSRTHEWAISARDFTAREADEAGFLSRVVSGGREDVLKVALSTAKEIASKSPIAVLGTRHLLLHARDHSVRENLEYTALWNQVMLQSGDVTEAIQSFIQKRPAKFRPLPKL